MPGTFRTTRKVGEAPGAAVHSSPGPVDRRHCLCGRNCLCGHFLVPGWAKVACDSNEH